MSCVKNRVIVVIGCRGLVRYDFVSTGQTVNHEFYLTSLGSLAAAVRNKRLEIRREQLSFRDDFDRELATLFRRFSQKTKVHCGSTSTLQPSSLQSRFFFFAPDNEIYYKGT